MLDEIINYVQSLQRQVEFLSMKLATVNPRLDFNIEGLLSKDFHQPRDGSSSTMGFSHDMINPHSHLARPGLVPPGMFSIPCPSNALRRALSAQLTMMSAYKEPTPQEDIIRETIEDVRIEATLIEEDVKGRSILICRLHIKGVTCTSCSGTIESALLGVQHIKGDPVHPCPVYNWPKVLYWRL